MKKKINFKSMSNREIVNFARENCSGCSPRELSDKFPGLCKQVQQRDLMGDLVEKEIIIRERKRKNMYSEITEKKLVEEVRREYLGKSLGDIQEENKLLYEEIRKRDLQNSLLQKGILRAKYRPNVFHKMSNEELTEFVADNYQGSTLKEFANSKDRRAYYIAHERGLIDGLVNGGVLKRNLRRPINTSQKFMSFIKKNAAAQNLVAIAASSGQDAPELERIMTELYPSQFGDPTKLHEFIEANRKQILGLIRNGVSDLGPYLGDVLIEDRPIVPLMLGKAIDSIKGPIPPSLEGLIYGVFKNKYSPSFNRDPHRTMEELEERRKQTSGVARKVYEQLYTHYRATLELEEVLA